jgi:hypothetical protein
MERLIDQFHAIVREFRLKRHDLLDYHNNKFDRDYVEFNVKVLAACTAVCGKQSTLCNLPATVNKIIIYVIEDVLYFKKIDVKLCFITLSAHGNTVQSSCISLSHILSLST